MDFSQKVKSARERMGFSQSELAAHCGVTVRSISAYETGRAKPRGVTLHKLAAALNVSPAFLLQENEENAAPQNDYVEYARQRYGVRGAQEMARLLDENRALFAGGDISESAKDDFFRAVMTAYLACKEEARQTYGRNSSAQSDED